MEKQKLFIFDMGNTLLDFHSGIHTDEEKDELGLSHMSKCLVGSVSLHIFTNSFLVTAERYENQI